VNRARVRGAARRYGWYAPLVAMMTAGALVAAGVLPLGGHGGSSPAATILAPGSSGSITRHPWWDPRGWFGAGSAARPRTITADGGPHAGRLPRQVAVPKPHRVRELSARRSANTRVFKLSDGRLQAAVSAGPVNYTDSRGKWQPVDTKVRPSTRPGYVYGNTSNTFRSFFGTAPARLVRFEAPGGGWLEVGLDGAHAGRPRVAGDRVTYPGVARGAGLEYQVTPDALKESITLASPAAASVYSYTIKVGGGLVPWQRRGGQVVFSRGEAGGPPVLVLPEPFMTSARKDAWSPYGRVWSPRVSQHMTWDPATRTARLSVSADAGWLRAPGRQFPVVIDPTIMVAPTPTDAQNTMIISDSGESTVNYSTSWRLSVGTDAGGASRALLKFPLTAIPAGTQVDSADLRMYYDQNFGAGTTDQTIEAHQATASWDASTATWSNASSNVGTEGLNEVIIDDSDAADTAAAGAWPTAASSPAANGEYRYNQDTVAGDKFTWVPPLAEAGNYFVADQYVATSNASTAAPFTVTGSGGSQAYTVNQQSGTGAVWSVLGQQPFAAGTAGKVVLGDGPASSTTRVIADAVRFRLWGAAVVNPSVAANTWNSFPARNIVQSWVNGTSPNYGFVVKSSTESTLNQGGPRYEASRFAYKGEVATYPQLVITYGRPSVTLNQITTIHATGADLSWSGYTDPTPGTNPGDDLAEYQVHRSVFQAFTPTASTLIAPVAGGTTTYSDTSEVPTPASSSQPFGNAFYYMVAVKTQDGQVIPGPVEVVRLPKAGYTQKIINASGATTLSKAQPTTAEQHLTGQPWLAVGDDSTTYGVTRTVVNYPSMSSAGIPVTATVTDAELKLWGWFNDANGSATFNAHALTQNFDPATATWNNASSGTPWTTAGGAFSATVTGTVSGLTNDPNRELWPVTPAVQGWVNTPSSEHGLLVKESAESSTSPQEQELFLDTSAAEPALRPELVVTYLDTTPDDTYYVPSLPTHLTSATSYTVPVTVTNTTGTTLSATNWVLSNHWTLPDGTDVSNSSNQVQTALPADLAPGDTVTVPNAQLTTPDTSSSGNIRTAYSIGWDLFNKTTGTWLSGTNSGLPAIAPLNQPASVAQPGSNLLGLEKYYQYTGVNTGSGTALLNNADNGNTVWSYNPFSNPSRGFATFVRLAYNSMDTSDSSMGFGWSLQTSTLMRLGTPLDFHPNPTPTTVTLTDGDGTSHWFTWNSTTSQWQSPPGLHYFLQQAGQCTPDSAGKTENPRAWLLTRPDRTQFYFDCQGYQTAVVDRNGNEADFTYTERNSANKPLKFLDYITDPTGRQTLTLSYYNKGDNYSFIDSNGNVASGTNLTNPKIIDEVKSITDISGRTITFLYTTQGLMAQMTDGDGSPLTKTFKFGYDMTQGNKNVKLVSVTDPRIHTTNLAYYTAPQDPKFKWSLNTITDRRTFTVGFAYTQPASGGIQTVVTDQGGNASTYVMDSTGRPVTATNPKLQKTQLAWDTDNNVTSLTEDNGAVTTWTYDPDTGYPKTMTDAQANHDGTAGTAYTYQTGLNGHIADLISKLTPQQRLWTFGYDAFGNLHTVTDPDGNASGAAPGSYTTTYAYDTLGELHTAQDANGNTTTYSNFDVTGYPQTITDPLGHNWTYGYDPRGAVLSSADPFNDTTSYQYDVFGRPGQVQIPKDKDPVTGNERYITIPAPQYDGNDNLTQSTDAAGAVTTYSYSPNDQLASKTLPPDDGAGTLRKYTYGYDKRGNPNSVIEPDGNVAGATPSLYTTTYLSDANNQLVLATDGAGDKTSYGYDDVGNRTSVTDPLGNLTKQDYNLSHWPTVATDAAGDTTSKGYDLDGKVTSATDQNASTTKYTLDPRGDVIQVMVPHDTSGGTTTYNTSQYVYDQAGNRTQVLTPRAIAAGISRASTCAQSQSQTCPYTYVTKYDADNQVTAQLSAYNSADPVYSTPAETDYTYNAVGRLKVVTSPPSGIPPAGGPNITKYGYFDNDWVSSSTDPWNITTSYDYNDRGQQKTRTIFSADGSMSRTMTRSYYPGGQAQSLTDHGVPTGLAAEQVDNSDFNNTSSTGPVGSWAKATSGTGYVGYDYQTHAKGPGTDAFTWNLNIPADGNYTVSVRAPVVPGAATNASFKVFYSGGSATVAVNQTTNSNGWVSLGKFAFTQAGAGQKVTLAQNSGGIVVADAVRAIRDNAGVTDTAHHDFTYSYDPNANLTGIADASPGAAISGYAATYNSINQLTKVDEQAGGVSQHTTTYGYDAAGNLTSRGHDSATSAYGYDARNLLATQTDKASASDPSPQVTTFTYTPDQMRKTEVKPNGNTVTYAYFADRLLQHQIETTPAGATADEHTYTYNPDGDKLTDAEKLMNADNTTAYLTHALAYTYDPRDRITQVQKDGTTTESYVHDATGNVTSQTLNATPATTYNYDRDRLLTAVTGTATATYNYDPLGRLDTVTSGSTVVERNAYDGFDHIIQHGQQNAPGSMDQTNYTWDPLGRLASQATPTAGAKTTSYTYLGLSSNLVTEAYDGQLTKTYTYTPAGERTSQTAHNTDGTTTPGYYTYNDHSDVEAVTGPAGTTKSTYGYTAYGQPIATQFTGADKNTTQPSATAVPYSSYRFNAMRWDSDSGQYDMGFRNYAPGINQFLTRDMYNGALADMNLATDPFTGNRYTFAAGNPISNIELDGHMFPGSGGCPPSGCTAPTSTSSGGGGGSGGCSGFFGCALHDITSAGAGAVNGIISIFTAPAASIAAGYSQAAGGLACGSYTAGCDPGQGAGLAARFRQIGARPVPVGDPGSGAYKGGYYGAPLLLGGAGGIAKLREILAAEDTGLADAAAACGGMSFTPGTKVLLASGIAVPIASLKPGDKVLATSTKTGRTRAEPVAAVLVHHDTNRYDLKVKTAHGTAVIHTTSTHLFWDPGVKRWVKAASLAQGAKLWAPGGTMATVLGGYGPRVRTGWMWDLTVAGDHDFYIQAAFSAVLVHNCAAPGGGEASRLDRIFPGPYARAGVALENRNINDPFVRDLINEAGNEYGCHTCGATEPGTPKGNWVVDELPPKTLVPWGTPQTAWPQCAACMLRQARVVSVLARELMFDNG